MDPFCKAGERVKNRAAPAFGLAFGTFAGVLNGKRC